MKKASKKKSPDWNMSQLNKVLKSLKKNKARDPMLWANERFRPENAGNDLKKSVLQILNLIKKE